MQHPYLANAFLSDGPPSPSPTRSKKRKRDYDEDIIETPTKTRSRAVSSQTLGLPTPNEKHRSEESQLLLQQDSQDDFSVPLSGGIKTPSSDSTSQLQQLTPPTSASPSIGPEFTTLPQVDPISPTRTRASTASAREVTPNPAFMLSIPSLVIQPPNSPLHLESLEAAILSLRRLLALNTSGSLEQPLPPEQEVHAWFMFAELGMQILGTMCTELDSKMSPPKSSSLNLDALPSWAPKPIEIEGGISRSLRLVDQNASLRPLRHQLTLIHAKLVFMQDNHKHSKFLLKRLLPVSTTSHILPREKAWTSYEAHLAITDQILNTPLPSLSDVIDVQAASSQLTALSMLADQYGDFAVRQLISVIRLTLLFQNYEVSDVVDSNDVDVALAETENILGLDGFDKANSAPTDQQPAIGATDDKAAGMNTTPGNTLSNIHTSVTPLTHDLMSGGAATALANPKTPAFSVPTNPLGMNVYSQRNPSNNLESTTEPRVEEDIIPPYLRYLRVQTLMIGVLWLTHCGNTTRSSERLTLIHEMMDKLSDMSKPSGMATGWGSGSDVGAIEIPLTSNPERYLRIQATHPRVLYQLTFVISGVVKRDSAGKRPKRKLFAEEGIRIGRWDDVRISPEAKPPIVEGGSSLDVAAGLGLQFLRQAKSSIEHLRAIAYCELISACLIRSEFDEAEQHLANLVSFIRACDGLSSDDSNALWDQFNSRITLLYGHLAHALGQSRRALDCYRLVCYLEEEGSMLWGMGMVGEIVLWIGIAAMRQEPPREEGDGKDLSEKFSQAGGFWKDGERDDLIQMASGVIEKCISGLWGDHMVVVGRLIAAALSEEIVRAKQNLKSGLDLCIKSRDSYLRLITLILTASQYVHTSSDYAISILETSKQLSASLGAKDGAEIADVERRSTRTSNGKESTQYHIGHARAGLWIGDRFLELYRRKNEREKAGKQNALNSVFEKAVQELDSKTGPEEQLTDISIPKPPAPLPEEDHIEVDKQRTKQTSSRGRTVTRKGDDNSKAPALRIDTSGAFGREKARATVSAGPTSTSSKAASPRKGHRQPYSAMSLSRSSGYSVPESAGTRRSVRSTASRKAIVESDDENADEDEDEYEEDDDDMD